MFDHKPNTYSYSDGKKWLFRDLYYQAVDSIKEQNEAGLKRVVEYVTWAEQQNDPGLQSCVDLAFFLPLFSEESNETILAHFPTEIVEEKRQLLKTNY